MATRPLVLTLVGLLVGTSLSALELPKGFSGGVQVGLAQPVGDDLKLTTGSGPNLDLGVHLDWEISPFHGLRSRVDLLTFTRGHQDVSAPLAQHLETKVQGLCTGCEYLYRLDGREGRWAAGAGLYLIRWSVDSTNRVTVTGAGSAQTTGTSHWTREGLGLVVTYRITPCLEAEARWLASHYGYENLPARMGTLGLLWRF